MSGPRGKGHRLPLVTVVGHVAVLGGSGPPPAEGR